MNLRFREEDVRLFYRLLDHRYLTELRFLRRGSYPVFKIVDNEEDFVIVCKKWNGKRNIYAGLRDRRQGLRKCATMADIIGVKIITLDIDPIREVETASTDEELNSAIRVASIIRDWFKEKGFQPPFRAMTGNGICLYFKIPFYQINESNRFEFPYKLEKFEQRMRKTFRQLLNENNCRIDPMYDLPRIAKVIGTLSVKGQNTKDRPHRVSYWLDKPIGPKEDENLLKFILAL